MKNMAYLFKITFINLTLINILSCTKDCNICTINCIDSSIIPAQNVMNSADLKRYLVRPDTFGANAIKIVPFQGYINWEGNIEVNHRSNIYTILFSNYSDTTNWQNSDNWAFRRENIIIEFDIEKSGRQKSYDEEANYKDSTLLRSIYFKVTADGDVSDANWQLDLNFESYIEITKIDKLKSSMEGNFNLYYKLQKQSTIPNIKYSNNAQFKCGYFKSSLF
ncbi:MAG: hypothetical protein ABI851_05775 [Saprospiraceae bacterium]